MGTNARITFLKTFSPRIMGKRKLFNLGNLGNWGKKRKMQGNDKEENKENVCASFVLF